MLDIPDRQVRKPRSFTLLPSTIARLEELVAPDPTYMDRMPDFLGTLAEVLERLEREPVEVELLPGRSVVVTASRTPRPTRTGSPRWRRSGTAGGG